MHVYIQTDNQGDFFNVNAYTAAKGFEHFGWEVSRYTDVAAIDNRDPNAVFVGGIGNVRQRLQQLGIDPTYELEYPATLQPFLHRKVWQSTLETLKQEPTWNVFIKPIQTKLFTGKVIRRFGDFIGLKYDQDVPIWCSEPIELVTEWRCFVRYRTLLDVRRYHGRWDSRLDVGLVERAIGAYQDQPAAYSLDFGVDPNGQHYLVEVNDGYSLGSYGMSPMAYAKFLSARWAELTSTEDQLDF